MCLILQKTKTHIPVKTGMVGSTTYNTKVVALFNVKKKTKEAEAAQYSTNTQH